MTPYLSGWLAAREEAARVCDSIGERMIAESFEARKHEPRRWSKHAQHAQRGFGFKDAAKAIVKIQPPEAPEHPDPASGSTGVNAMLHPAPAGAKLPLLSFTLVCPHGRWESSSCGGRWPCENIPCREKWVRDLAAQAGVRVEEPAGAEPCSSQPEQPALCSGEAARDKNTVPGAQQTEPHSECRGGPEGLTDPAGGVSSAPTGTPRSEALAEALAHADNLAGALRSLLLAVEANASPGGPHADKDFGPERLLARAALRAHREGSTPPPSAPPA